MAKVIKGFFSTPRRHSQEPGGGDKPDVERPPDKDVPDFDKHVPDDRSESPPFTGEDVEDIPRPDPPSRKFPLM
jgi:hypothetical protein